MSYEEFCADQEAVQEGRATELVGCYICPPVMTSTTNPHGGLEPLRGVLRRYTGGDKADPSEVLVLSCGHEIL